MPFITLTPTSSGTDSSSKSPTIEAFFPPVAQWWRDHFPTLSPAQQLAIPIIAAGQHTLVCAPTGTGKTLCAFIALISDLFTRHAAGTLQKTIDTIYISPLKALGADINRNLLQPLEEITTDHPITVAQRTGDTTPHHRAKLIKNPPHILITTPESLALCLASPAMRQHLTAVRRIIIDELHALAPNKRGSDLMLSVERLARLVISHGHADPQRIGLSATIAPLSRIAEFLVGSAHAARDCTIVDASFHRPIDLTIAAPFGQSPFQTTAATNRHVYDFLEQTIRQHKTTLIFTNTRAATERVTFQLRKRFAFNAKETKPNDFSVQNSAFSVLLVAPEQIAAHHSSLDRDLRLDIESRLKQGLLRAVVCSTSLELGIDIGSIDHVVLLNSPKGVARGLQRAGRSGHSLHATAAATFLPTVPADLLEAIVTAQAMRRRHLSEIHIPQNPLDVLAQQLIGMTLQAQPRGLNINEAYHLITSTTPYATLTQQQFTEILNYLATTDPTNPPPGAKLFLEATTITHQDNSMSNLPSPQRPPDPNRSLRDLGVLVSSCLDFGGPQATLSPLRKSLATLYAQNIGTITQESQVKVRLQKADGPSSIVGSVEEAFAQMLKPLDRFVLSGQCLQVIGTRGMSIEVTPCQGQAPTVPRWFSGMMPMEPGLAAQMRDFRAKIRALAPAGEAAIARFLIRQYLVPDHAAKLAAQFLHAQFRYADIPAPDTGLLVERTPDDSPTLLANDYPEGVATVLTFHTMIGRAANEALARAIAYRLATRFRGSGVPPVSHNTGDSPPPDTISKIQNSAFRIQNFPNAAVIIDDHAFAIWIDANSHAKRADRTLLRSLLSPQNFQQDLAAAVEASELFRTQFRYTALRAHAILQNKFGCRRFVGQLHSYAQKLHEALQQTEPNHILLQETRRTVFNDILSAPAAIAYLESLAHQPITILDLPIPSPFAFSLFAAGAARKDSLQLADTADFLLAMYHQVQQRLQQSQPEAQPQTLFSGSKDRTAPKKGSYAGLL